MMSYIPEPMTFGNAMIFSVFYKGHVKDMSFMQRLFVQ